MVEEKQKLSQTNVSISKELDDINRGIQEGFAQVMEASKEATKRVGQLNLGLNPPVLEGSCRSLPAVAEFIARVAADVRVF